MGGNSSRAFCKCGEEVFEAEDRIPCPKCGGLGRDYSVDIHEQVVMHSMLGLAHKRPGYKRPIYEAKSGDSLFKKTGVWNRLTQEIDRLNNRYRKRIEAPDGTILRDDDGPLDEHVGFGSAKKKRDPE